MTKQSLKSIANLIKAEANPDVRREVAVKTAARLATNNPHLKTSAFLKFCGV